MMKGHVYLSVALKILALIFTPSALFSESISVRLVYTNSVSRKKKCY
jgi:hypothetical protein